MKDMQVAIEEAFAERGFEVTAVDYVQNEGVWYHVALVRRSGAWPSDWRNVFAVARGISEELGTLVLAC